MKYNPEQRGPHHPDVATTLTNLAEALHECCEYGEAKERYRRAQAIRDVLQTPHTARVE